MDEQANIILRSAVSNDKNFILSTWLKGQYYGSSYFRQIPPDLYYSEYAKKITEILFTPGVQIIVACDDLNPTWIVGFSVYKDSEIYWVYVKKDYRRKGIATLLTSAHEMKTVKATTKVGRAIAENKGLQFNPF